MNPNSPKHNSTKSHMGSVLDLLEKYDREAIIAKASATHDESKQSDSELPLHTALPIFTSPPLQHIDVDKYNMVDVITNIQDYIFPLNITQSENLILSMPHGTGLIRNSRTTGRYTIDVNILTLVRSFQFAVANDGSICYFYQYQTINYPNFTNFIQRIGLVNLLIPHYQ
jgi:hypothetical protein